MEELKESRQLLKVAWGWGGSGWGGRYIETLKFEFRDLSREEQKLSLTKISLYFVKILVYYNHKGKVDFSNIRDSYDNCL